MYYSLLICCVFFRLTIALFVYNNDRSSPADGPNETGGRADSAALVREVHIFKKFVNSFDLILMNWIHGLPSVLPDLVICRHLGYFFNHLATNILIWRLGKLATFLATF